MRHLFGLRCCAHLCDNSDWVWYIWSRIFCCDCVRVSVIRYGHILFFFIVLKFILFASSEYIINIAYDLFVAGLLPGQIHKIQDNEYVFTRISFITSYIDYNFIQFYDYARLDDLTILIIIFPSNKENKNSRHNTAHMTNTDRAKSPTHQEEL